MMQSKKAFVGSMVFLALMAAVCGIATIWRLGPFAPLGRPAVADESSGTPLPGTDIGDVTTSEPISWEVPGARWRVHVKQYTQGFPGMFGDAGLNTEARVPKVQAEFDVFVEVLPFRYRADHKIARFRFAPIVTAPAYLQNRRLVLEVDTTTGEVCDLKPLEPEAGYIDLFEGIQYLRTRLSGFPVDWMIRSRDLTSVPATNVTETKMTPDARAQLVKTLEPAVVPASPGKGEFKKVPAVRIKLSERRDGITHYVIAQTWVPGESWWRTFQRYRGERIDLEAAVVGAE